MGLNRTRTIGLLMLALGIPAAAAAVQATADTPNLPAEVAGYRDRLVIAHVGASQSDLAAFQIADRPTGAVLRVYYEPAARQLAEAQLPYLAWMIDQLARHAATEPGEVVWDEIVFTTDPAYAPPRGGSQARWSVLAGGDGRLTEAGEQMLFQTLPHEQVHAIQKAHHARLPRWFAEGQASWIEQQVTRQIRPDLTLEWREMALGAMRDATAPLSLGAWGGLVPKREAILRQVSAEDRARMEADPSYFPSGAFSFGPDDVISDESNTLARYGAALTLFEQLEQQAGSRKMEAWLRAIWSEPEPPPTERIAQLAREHLQQDLAPRLE